MSSDRLAQLDNPWPHRWAVVVVCATFPLIWVGGLVTTYGAGMAVPDWPTTFGYNLFLYPWQTWIFGPFDLFIEHGHRLLGALVGLLTIAFVCAVFWTDRRSWMRVVSIVALLAVIGQGGLGGMRVRLDDRQFAMLHGCIGPAFFALAVAMAAFTSSWWRQVASASQAAATGVCRDTVLAAVLAYVQLVLGATLRHFPLDLSANVFRLAVVFHLILALVLSVHALSLAVRVTRRHRDERRLLRPVYGLCGLLAAQLALGAGTWIVKFGWPGWFENTWFAAGYTIQARSLVQSLTITAHVATGSLVLVTSVLLAVRSLRLFSPLRESSARRATTHPWDSSGDSRRSGFSRISRPCATETIA